MIDLFFRFLSAEVTEMTLRPSFYGELQCCVYFTCLITVAIWNYFFIPLRMSAIRFDSKHWITTVGFISLVSTCFAPCHNIHWYFWIDRQDHLISNAHTPDTVLYDFDDFIEPVAINPHIMYYRLCHVLFRLVSSS